MKVGIASQVLLLGYVAFFPELTTNMSVYIAVSAGVDTLCHLLECSTAAATNPVNDNVALTGLSKLFRRIQPAVNDPQGLRAKLEMLWASYYDGIAITHAGTHLAHALSYPLGGKYHLPHGVTNAILLAPCMVFACPWAVEKFARVWDCIPDAEAALSAEEKSHVLVTRLQALVNQLKLPNNLVALGVPPEDIAPLNEAAPNAKRLMSNVPCQIDLQDVQAIYQTLFPQYPSKE